MGVKSDKGFITTLVKIQRKGQVTLPIRFRAAVGLSKGDFVEVSMRNGKIVMQPQVVIDHSKFPNADDEYTPEQRRVIDARLAKAEEAIKAGRVYGPFNTAEEMAASIEANIKRMRLQ